MNSCRLAEMETRLFQADPDLSDVNRLLWPFSGINDSPGNCRRNLDQDGRLHFDYAGICRKWAEHLNVDQDVSAKP